MKKEVHIHIYIDDEEVAKASSSMMDKRYPNHQFIEIYRDETAPDHKLDDLLAHELGHSIQRIFNTDAYKEDIRNQVPPHFLAAMEDVFGMPPGYKKSIIDGEKEAWEYARKMIPIDNNLAEKDLNTYREHYPLPDDK